MPPATKPATPQNSQPEMGSDSQSHRSSLGISHGSTSSGSGRRPRDRLAAEIIIARQCHSRAKSYARENLRRSSILGDCQQIGAHDADEQAHPKESPIILATALWYSSLSYCRSDRFCLPFFGTPLRWEHSAELAYLAKRLQMTNNMAQSYWKAPRTRSTSFVRRLLSF